jgi:dipeptidyl aminopeptidase/acylaminoacyl peptidase
MVCFQATAVLLACPPRLGAAPAMQAPDGVDSIRVSIPVRGPADTIAATLSLPARRSTARIPAVVTISGLGKQTRDGMLPLSQGPRLFGQLAEALAVDGFAVLRWDDRGTGGSAPRAEQSPPLHEVVQDVMAISAWLGRRPEIDPDRIVLLGHSGGGLVALAASRSPTQFAGVVLMASPGRVLQDMFVAQDEAAIRETPDLARDSVRQARQARRTHRLREDAFVREALALSPESLASEVRIPALVLQGTADRQVPPDNAVLLARALERGGAPTKLGMLPGLTHFFVAPTTEADRTRHKAGTPSVPAVVLDLVTAWLSQLPAGAGRP